MANEVHTMKLKRYALEKRLVPHLCCYPAGWFTLLSLFKKPLDIGQILLDIFHGIIDITCLHSLERADSSAGRAQPLQGWGHRFDPCSAYHKIRLRGKGLELGFFKLRTPDSKLPTNRGGSSAG